MMCMDQSCMCMVLNLRMFVVLVVCMGISVGDWDLRMGIGITLLVYMVAHTCFGACMPLGMVRHTVVVVSMVVCMCMVLGVVLDHTHTTLRPHHHPYTVTN